jgi:uncharacterized protein (TIGR03382 family)
MKQIVTMAMIGCALICAAAQADTTVKVDPSAGWIGFMNVSNLPADGGAYQFGSGWGTTDLKANFSGPTLTLQACFVNDPSTYWYIGGGAPGAPGNKIMDANMYVEKPAGTYAGQTLTFQGNVLSNTLVSPYTSVAFIKDFAPDYSSNVSITVPVTPGPFTLSLATINDPGRHVQYGFETIGPDAWSTEIDSKGSVVIASVPEPATMTLAGLAALGLAALGRRRR